MKSSKRLSLFALLALVAALACGCEDDKGPTPAPTATVSVLTPVPAPAGLLGEVFMPAPDATWARARGAMGGVVTLLPQTFGGLVTTLVGLPITSSSEVDGDMAVLGAIVDAPGQPRPRAALGVHVKVGDRLLTQATKGDSPLFNARVDKATSITLLDPKGIKGPVALGILGNYLLVAEDEASLLEIGPYVARTMPAARNLPKDDVTIDVPEKALAGPIHTNVKTAWDRVSGRDSALSGAIQPLIDVDAVMDTALAVIADLARARVAVNLVGDAVRVRLALSPKAGDGAAARMAREMAVGDAERLLELPADTLVALMWRDRSEARGAAATARAGALAGLVGKDIPAKDREAIAAALGAAAEARGDWFVGGLSLGSTGPAGYGRGAMKDAQQLEKALKGLFAASTLPSVKSRLAMAKLTVSSGKTVVEDVSGDVLRLKLSRVEEKAKKKAGPAPSGSKPVEVIPTSIELLARLEKEQFLLAAGYDAREALRGLIAADERDNLREIDSIKTTVGSLGSEVAFALVVEPLRIVAARAGKPGAAESAPVLVAWGTERESKETLWVRLDVANVAVRELVKRRGAF